MDVSILCLFLAMPCIGLQSVIIAFLGPTHLLYGMHLFGPEKGKVRLRLVENWQKIGSLFECELS